MVRSALTRIDPVWLVLFGIASVQLGASFAKDLFALSTPTATAWLRLCFASLIFLTFARPRLRGRRPREWVIVGGYGLALLLNLVFYPVRQLVVQTVLLGGAPTLRGGRLDVAIGHERNVGMGALEAVAYVATALLMNGVAMEVCGSSVALSIAYARS